MNKKQIGYIIQFAGVIALAIGVFYAPNVVKALVIFGAAALVAGRHLRTQSE